MSRDWASNSGPRVVHLTTAHRPFDPRIFYKQLASVREAGFDAHLVAPHERTETVDGITIHGLPPPENRLERVRLQPRVLREARALDASVYQIHDPELLPLARLLKMRTGAAVVYDMHEDYRSKGAISGRTIRVIERWAFSWLDHILFAEKSYRPILIDRSVGASYIPNYVAPVVETGSASEPEGGLSARPRLLYTGTISETRGLRTMIELATLIRENGRAEVVELVGICRYPEQRRRAERKIRRQGLASVLTRVGWDAYVDPPALWARYQHADVGLALFERHPNYRHSIPTKFYECLHFGLPLICSDVPLWREFIERTDCGAVVPPGDPSAVLEVLDAWNTQPDRYGQLAKNARAAAEDYRWGPVGERLVEIYRDLIGDADRQQAEEGSSTIE